MICAESHKSGLGEGISLNRVTTEFIGKVSSGDRGASPGERGHRGVKVTFRPGRRE